jgi:hypothetical protein
MSFATADGETYVFGCARKAAALRHALENGHLSE